MPNHHVSFGKIVATPTPTAWSQAYHAGNLFAVLSLESAETNDGKSLNALGKELFNNLEAEFFTLEEKSFASIKQALSDVVKAVPSSLLLSFCVAYAKDAALYVFVLGSGSIVIKRGDSIGSLLRGDQASVTDNKAIKSASGMLQDNDIIVLQTAQFEKIVNKHTLTDALSQPDISSMSEEIAPQVHKTEEGGASAMFLSYTGSAASEEAMIAEEEESEDEEEAQSRSVREEIVHDTHAAEPKTERTKLGRRFRIGSFLPRFPSLSFSLSHKRKVFLSIAVILICVLAASIYLSVSKKENAQTKAAFIEVYAAAQKHYDEGQGLAILNKNLAQDDYKKAKKLLEEKKELFKSGSDERKQIDTLLAKVDAELEGTSNAKEVAVSEAATDASKLLTAVEGNSDAIAGSEYEDTIYLLTRDAVRKTGEKEALIENTDTWSKAQGLSVYSGNVYVLDQKEGVIKFVAGSGGYGKTAYFSGSGPDLSKAVSMAIDGSVYILTTDGKIMKYTRGGAESFNIGSINTPLSSPSRIFTNVDTDNVYVLDNGNSRIVKLSKEGALLSEYRSSKLQSAKDMDISEKDKKAYFLSGEKIYELSL